ncbi:unnamed protein product [Closterium sp. NIES-65]|nr:unnamed protein product [Closterium sp. NIES-65]
MAISIAFLIVAFSAGGELSFSLPALLPVNVPPDPHQFHPSFLPTPSPLMLHVTLSQDTATARFSLLPFTAHCQCAPRRFFFRPSDPTPLFIPFPFTPCPTMAFSYALLTFASSHAPQLPFPPCPHPPLPTAFLNIPTSPLSLPPQYLILFFTPLSHPIPMPHPFPHSPIRRAPPIPPSPLHFSISPVPRLFLHELGSGPRLPHAVAARVIGATAMVYTHAAVKLSDLSLTFTRQQDVSRSVCEDACLRTAMVQSRCVRTACAAPCDRMPACADRMGLRKLARVAAATAPEEAVESNGQRTPSLSDVPPLKPLSDPSLLPTHLGLPPFSPPPRPMPGVARP